VEKVSTEQLGKVHFSSVVFPPRSGSAVDISSAGSLMSKSFEKSNEGRRELPATVSFVESCLRAHELHKELKLGGIFVLVIIILKHLCAY